MGLIAGIKSYIEQKLLFIFFILLCCILVLTFKIYKNNQLNKENALLVEQTKEELFDGEAISNSIKTLESGSRGYALTGDTAFLKNFNIIKQSIFTRIAHLKMLNNGHGSQQERIDSLSTLVNLRLASIHETVDLINSGGIEAAKKHVGTKVGLSNTQRIDSLINVINIEEENLLAIRKDANLKSNNNYKLFCFVLITALILLLSGAFIYIYYILKARRKAESSLLENKEILQAIIDNTTSIIYVKDLEGKYILANKQFKKATNKTDVVGKTSYELFPAPVADSFQKLENQVFADGKLIELENSFMQDGELNYFVTALFPLYKGNGEVYGLGGISTNITHVKAKAQLEKQKEINEVTLKAQENERNHLARELHDNVNQILASAKLMLEAGISMPEMQEMCLKKSREAIMDATAEIRTLSHALEVPPFEGSDFTHAIEDMLQGMNVGGKIKTHLSFLEDEQLGALNEQVKITLYRIIQEQMNNTLKYAQANNVTVELKPKNQNIYLSIADDGVGFDMQTKTKGIGLRNIQNRVEFYSGTMLLTSAPNNGCKLEIEIPMSNN